MNIEILKYHPTKAPQAFAYVDLRIGPLTINGVNLRRDGTITGGMLVYAEKAPGQKTAVRQAKPAMEIQQDHPWALEILAAIERHTAAMPAHVKAPPAWTPEEIEAKKQKRLNWEKAQREKGAKEKAITDAVKRAAKAAVPNFKQLPPEERQRIKDLHRARIAATSPPAPKRVILPPPPPIRATIEPGKPLISRPPLRKQG